MEIYITSEPTLSPYQPSHLNPTITHAVEIYIYILYLDSEIAITTNIIIVAAHHHPKHNQLSTPSLSKNLDAEVQKHKSILPSTYSTIIRLLKHRT
jgi:hypothetical protein